MSKLQTKVVPSNNQFIPDKVTILLGERIVGSIDATWPHRIKINVDGSSNDFEWVTLNKVFGSVQAARQYVKDNDYIIWTMLKIKNIS